MMNMMSLSTPLSSAFSTLLAVAHDNGCNYVAIFTIYEFRQSASLDCDKNNYVVTIHFGASTSMPERNLHMPTRVLSPDFNFIILLYQIRAKEDSKNR